MAVMLPLRGEAFMRPFERLAPAIGFGAQALPETSLASVISLLSLA